MPQFQPGYRVGECEVIKIAEREMSITASSLYPNHISPTDKQEDIVLSVHSWVVRTPTDIIVIDTGTGNNRDRDGHPLFHQLETDYLQNLHAAGIRPEEVSLVLMTHLHIDHVGWNTTRCGDGWVPLFPHARYICSEKELRQIQAGEQTPAFYQDSLLPVIKAGLLESVDIAQQPVLAGVLQYMPTPGHSYDHASVTLSSAGEYAIFTGDIMHSPVQFCHPDWSSVFCDDPQQAELSRRKVIDWSLTHNALWFSSHFAGKSAGRVKDYMQNPPSYGREDMHESE